MEDIQRSIRESGGDNSLFPGQHINFSSFGQNPFLTSLGSLLISPKLATFHEL